jgi:hypothetical protein
MLKTNGKKGLQKKEKVKEGGYLSVTLLPEWSAFLSQMEKQRNQREEEEERGAVVITGHREGGDACSFKEGEKVREREESVSDEGLRWVAGRWRMRMKRRWRPLGRVAHGVCHGWFGREGEKVGERVSRVKEGFLKNKAYAWSFGL